MDLRSPLPSRHVLAVAAAVTVAVSCTAIWRAVATDTVSATATAVDPEDIAGAAQVEIHDFAFGPQTITVAAGAGVVWTNGDQVAHSIASDDGTFDEQTMGAGDTAFVRIAAPGTYRYICGIHPVMTGTIEVTP